MANLIAVMNPKAPNETLHLSYRRRGRRPN